MRQPKNNALAPLLSLQKLSQKSFSIANLIQMANSRQTFDDMLNTCLPNPLAGHFKVNSFNDNTLILTCTSAKFMTRFRVIQDSVVSKLNRLIEPKKIHTIQIKVRPNIQSKPAKAKINTSLRSISKKNAQILLKEAEHTVDPNLKNILTNLAKNADK